MRTCDAVVIGAGHNGLVAANILADAGWDVVVLEATATPGGSVKTTESTPGFRSDVCSAFYPLGAVSPVLTELDLDEYGLRWCHAPAVLAHIMPDDRCARLSRDPSETADCLSSFAAADGETWLDETQRFERIREPLLETFLRPFPPLRGVTRLLRTLGGGEAARFARLTVLPVRRYGAERFRGDGAQLLMAGSALHTDLGPEQAGSAVFGWLLAMLGQTIGFPVPQGGAVAITDALIRRLNQRGVTVECQRAVSRVLHAGGRVVGVIDEHGEHIRAKRAVLADVSAPVLYEDLIGLDALPEAFVNDLKRFQWDNATLKLDWALSGPIPWTAAGAHGAGTVHLDADIDGLSAYGTDLINYRRPREPFILLGQMTTADPTRSPPGTESVWAYTHIPQAIADQTETLREHAEQMEQVIERHAPGFTASIVSRHVDLPADLQRHNPSLLGGALNAGSAAIHQQLIFRPTIGLGRADTPLDRLYLASASAHPGGGVHGAPGANAARAALARNGHLGGAYQHLIAGAHRHLYQPDEKAQRDS
jgi:phytoene dehydrogenase-like protein